MWKGSQNIITEIDRKTVIVKHGGTLKGDNKSVQVTWIEKDGEGSGE